MAVKLDGGGGHDPLVFVFELALPLHQGDIGLAEAALLDVHLYKILLAELGLHVGAEGAVRDGPVHGQHQRRDGDLGVAEVLLLLCVEGVRGVQRMADMDEGDQGGQLPVPGVARQDGTAHLVIAPGPAHRPLRRYKAGLDGLEVRPGVGQL